MLHPDPHSRKLYIEVKISETLEETGTGGYIASGTYAGHWISQIAQTAELAVEKCVKSYEEKFGHTFTRVKVEESALLEHEPIDQSWKKS